MKRPPPATIPRNPVRDPLLSVPPGDLRAWLAATRKRGEVREISGANWNLEIGDVSRVNYTLDQPRALLFTDISGYPTGRVVTGTISTPRRLGMTLRLGDDHDDQSLISALRGAPARWLADAERYPVKVVTDGPVLEHVVSGADANFLDYPAPLWNEGDGGRFIGTGCIAMTSDPITGVVNGGAYRMQVHGDGAMITMSIVAGKDGWQNVQAWFAREGRAPVTVSLGHDPLLLIVAGTSVPMGTSELAYAGAIAGEPLEVVIAENGLPVPARAELALEGWIRPDNLAPEGPFGEWTGYYSESAEDAFVVETTRLFHRTDPILLGVPPGKPPHDYSFMRCAMTSALVSASLETARVPGIHQVWAHTAGGGRLLLAVSIEQRYAGHARQVAYLTSQLPAGAYMNRYVVVVDSDIDVRSLEEVMWAVCSRTEPCIDVEIMRRTYGSGADPLLPPGAPPFMSRAIIDACIPYERRDQFPRPARADPRRMDSVRVKWQEALQ